MSDPLDSPDSNAPRQLTLPQCSVEKTRRRRGKALRRRPDSTTLVIRDMEDAVVALLKARAKSAGQNYTDYCRAVLRDHAYPRPGRRR